MELAFALLCLVYVVYMVSAFIVLGIRAAVRGIIRLIRGRPAPPPPPPPARAPLTQEERDRRASALRPRSVWLHRKRWPLSHRP